MSDDPDLRDLPSLDRWGDELRDATERAERRTGRRRAPMRRMAVAVAVMLLAVPGAIATRNIWMDPVDAVDPLRDPATPPVVRLAEGRSGDIRWRLGAVDRSGTRCVELETFRSPGPLGGGCSPVPVDRSQIVAATRGQDDTRFVFGTVAAEVAEVIVTVAGGGRARVSTLAPDPDSLRRASLPDLRVFVAAFEGGFDPTVPPVVVALDSHGHEIGHLGGSARP